MKFNASLAAAALIAMGASSNKAYSSGLGAFNLSDFGQTVELGAVPAINDFQTPPKIVKTASTGVITASCDDDSYKYRKADPLPYGSEARETGSCLLSSYYDTASETIDLAPGDNRELIGPVTLKSHKNLEYRQFYKANGQSYYRDFTVEQGEPASKRIILHFPNRGSFNRRSWEHESLIVTFKGEENGNGTVKATINNAAFEYNYRLESDMNDPLTADVNIYGGAKILTAPDAKAVDLTLLSGGSNMQLRVTDAHAEDYAGETLDIQVEVRKSCGHIWCKDEIVMPETTLQLTIPVQGLIDVPKSRGSGQYRIKSWSFRRANSRISRPDWVSKGTGPYVTR